MSLFERYLTVWVALCIVVGVALGYFLPEAAHVLGSMEVAHVNLPVAVLIWLMIVPMLLRVDFGAIGQVAQHWRGIAVTLGVNWLVKPFSMALLAWIFIRNVFAPYLPAEQLDSYIAVHGAAASRIRPRISVFRNGSIWTWSRPLLRTPRTSRWRSS